RFYMTNIFKTIIVIAATVVFTVGAFAQGGDLGSKHWQLTNLNGTDVGETKAFVEIDPRTGKFNGSTGCNRMMGSASITGQDIAFWGVAITKRACEPDVMKLEGDFTKTLVTSTRYHVDGDVLSVFNGKKKILSFKAGEADGGSSATIRLQDKKWMLD